MVTLSPSIAAAPATWERVASLPVGNGGFVGSSLGGEILIAGGTTWQGETKLWLDQIWAYSPARNTWREAGRLPTPIAYGVCGNHDGALWVAGGSGGTKSNPTLWRLDSAFAAQPIAQLETNFVYAAGVMIGSTLYAVGGTDDQAKLDRVTNHFRAIDVRTGKMTRLADYPEVSVTTATAAALDGRVYVFGGARWNPAGNPVVNHATAHAYAIASQRWETLPPLPHPGRGYTALALDDRHLFLAGGYRNDVTEFTADAYLFNVLRNTYLPTSPLPYAGMVGLVKHGEWVYCLGGEDRKKHRADAVFRIRWQELLKR